MSTVESSLSPKRVAGLHVEEVIEEALVARHAGLPAAPAARCAGSAASRACAGAPAARDVAALDADRVGREPEADRRDARTTATDSGPGQAVARVGGVPEEAERALLELDQERVDHRAGELRVRKPGNRPERLDGAAVDRREREQDDAAAEARTRLKRRLSIGSGALANNAPVRRRRRQTHSPLQTMSQKSRFAQTLPIPHLRNGSGVLRHGHPTTAPGNSCGKPRSSLRGLGRFSCQSGTQPGTTRDPGAKTLAQFAGPARGCVRMIRGGCCEFARADLPKGPAGEWQTYATASAGAAQLRAGEQLAASWVRVPKSKHDPSPERQHPLRSAAVSASISRQDAGHPIRWRGDVDANLKRGFARDLALLASSA